MASLSAARICFGTLLLSSPAQMPTRALRCFVVDSGATTSFRHEMIVATSAVSREHPDAQLQEEPALRSCTLSVTAEQHSVGLPQRCVSSIEPSGLAGGSTVLFLQHSNQLFEHPSWTKGTDSGPASGLGGTAPYGLETRQATPPLPSAFLQSTPNSVGKSLGVPHRFRERRTWSLGSRPASVVWTGDPALHCFLPITRLFVWRAPAVISLVRRTRD